MSGLIGQNFGRYQILELIGEGGMATVYKAHDTHLEREVAIKIIRSEVFPPDQLTTILKRFEREAKALGGLSHPNIVGVIDYGEHEGSPYLVMVYLRGGTLKDLLGKAMPWRAVPGEYTETFEENLLKLFFLCDLCGKRIFVRGLV